jgi:hypothetical protein
MSRIGLGKVISAEFIQRFTQIASSSAPISSTLNGGQSSQSLFGAGLRIGARTFSTALNGLNDAVSFVNLSQQALQDLSKITDQLIDVTRRATDVSSGSGTREQLDIEFKRLAGEFRRAVENATTGDNEFLTKEGLSEIFASIGLDENSSDAIAQIFSQFVTPETDGTLASEKVAASQVNIPVGAFGTRRSDSEYLIDRLNLGVGSAIRQGMISTVNSLAAAADNVLGQNPGIGRSLLAGDTDGSISGIQAGLATSNVTLLAVNETTGYSVVETTSDLLGYNPSNYSQIYLMNERGQAVSQVTNNTSATIDYNYADVNEGSDRVAYIEEDSLGASVMYVDVTIGMDPSLYHSTTVATTGNIFPPPTSIKISNDGRYLAWADHEAGSLKLYSITAVSYEAAVGSLSAEDEFGFIANGSLVSLGATTHNLSFVTYGDGDLQTLLDDYSGFSRLAVLQDGGLTMYNETTHELRRFDTAGVLQQSYQFNSGDDLHDFSLAFNRDDPTKIDIGFIGSGTTFGSSEEYLYRYYANPAYTNGRPQARGTPALYDPISAAERNSIFDDSRHISNRAEAYRTLADLKELKEQIGKNLNALGSARTVLNDNIKLVRAAGAALLELSEQVKSSSDAESLAEALREKILKSAQSVLAQAENLSPITVAALTRSA